MTSGGFAAGVVVCVAAAAAGLHCRTSMVVKLTREPEETMTSSASKPREYSLNVACHGDATEGSVRVLLHPCASGNASRSSAPASDGAP